MVIIMTKVIKISEMGNILFSKLQDKGCYFKKSDISIKKVTDYVEIVIKDYEHVPFKMRAEKDDYFGYLVTIDSPYGNVAFVESKTSYDYKNALIQLGYYIGTRF